MTRPGARMGAIPRRLERAGRGDRAACRRRFRRPFACPRREGGRGLSPEADAVFGYLVRSSNLRARRNCWIHSGGGRGPVCCSPNLRPAPSRSRTAVAAPPRSMAEQRLRSCSRSRQLPRPRDRQREGAWGQMTQWRSSPGFLELEEGATSGARGLRPRARGSRSSARRSACACSRCRRPRTSPGSADAQWGVGARAIFAGVRLDRDAARRRPRRP